MLQIAKVLKSNGIDGDILIGIRDIEIQDIDLKEPVFIYFDGLPVPFFIESISPKGTGKAIVHITDVQITDLRNHMRQQGIAGNVKRDAQKHISTTLVQLAREFAVMHKKLEQGMTRW